MSAPAVGDIWYRYVDVVYAGFGDEYGERGPSRLDIQVHEYCVVRVSAKCAWLASSVNFAGQDVTLPDARRVLLSAHRKFACPTRDAALASFVARKCKQASIYEARARRAREAIQIATRLEVAA